MTGPFLHSGVDGGGTNPRLTPSQQPAAAALDRREICRRTAHPLRPRERRVVIAQPMLVIDREPLHRRVAVARGELLPQRHRLVPLRLARMQRGQAQAALRGSTEARIPRDGAVQRSRRRRAGAHAPARADRRPRAQARYTSARAPRPARPATAGRSGCDRRRRGIPTYRQAAATTSRSAGSDWPGTSSVRNSFSRTCSAVCSRQSVQRRANAARVRCSRSMCGRPAIGSRRSASR